MFTKQRNSPTEEPAYEFSFQPDLDDSIRITYKKAASADVVLEWVRNGLDSCEDIAREMGLSKGQVSKLAKRLKDDGRLVITSRRYKVPDE